MMNKIMQIVAEKDTITKEISDDVVRLIAYNQEAFADFANISDQSDVESFNQKYNVEEQEPGNRFLLQPREADYTTTTDGKNLYDLDPMKNVDPDEKMQG